MRLNKSKWKNIGRSLAILLFVCGIAFSAMPGEAEAVDATFYYERVMEASALPTDNAWHDYFIAWEDDGDYWFINEEYFEDGDSNFWERSSWFEITANTRLSSIAAGAKDKSSFSSSEKYGNMQIRFVGYDTENRNSGAPAPMYRIRFARSNGEYYYLDWTDFEGEEGDGAAYTVQDKTYEGEQCFHIYVNIGGQADRYLTRDDENLESSLSSSSYESEYPLRLYKVEKKANYTYENGGVAASGNLEIKNGWITFYRYTLLDDYGYFIQDNFEHPVTGVSHHEKNLMDPTKWYPILLAWRGYEGEQNGDTIYFCNSSYVQTGGDKNYWNSNAGLRFHVLADGILGTDRYTSADAPQFVTKEKLGNFEILYKDRDMDNDHLGLVGTGFGHWGLEPPRYYIRFWSIDQKWEYITKVKISDDPADAYPWTFRARMEGDKKNDPNYGYGTMEIFSNYTAGYDYVMTRHNTNEVSNSRWDLQEEIERQMMVYLREELKYLAILDNIVVGNGQIMRIDEHVVLADDVTITVKEGGLLVIDDEMYFNGNINVEVGGTMVINSGGTVVPFDPETDGAQLNINGGNVVVMNDARLFLEEGNGVLNITKGGSLVNWGLVMASRGIRLIDNAKFVNQPGAELVIGKIVPNDRGALHSLAIDQIMDRAVDSNAQSVLYLSNGARLSNSGNITTAQADGVPADKNEPHFLADEPNFLTESSWLRMLEGTIGVCFDNSVCEKLDGGTLNGVFQLPVSKLMNVLYFNTDGYPVANYDLNDAVAQFISTRNNSGEKNLQKTLVIEANELVESLREYWNGSIFSAYIGKKGSAS